MLLNLMPEMQYGCMVTLDLARQVDPAREKQALLRKAGRELMVRFVILFVSEANAHFVIF